MTQTYRKLLPLSLLLAILYCASPLTATSAEERAPSTSSAKPEKDRDDDQPDAEKNDTVKMWFRLVRVDISEDSPLRQDKKFNDPPSIYVVLKATGAKERTSTKKSGWRVEFPETLGGNQMLVSNSEKDKYTLKVWDSQWGPDSMLFSVAPHKGSDLQRQLTSAGNKNLTKHSEITLTAEKQLAEITLAYAGTRTWFRLRNVTIPPESSHRKTLSQAPRPYVIVKLDGLQLGDRSTIGVGWSVDFPKGTANSWPIRDGADHRYTIEVWNARGRDGLVFNVTGLSGSDFREVILEPTDLLVGPGSAGHIEFEKTQEP